MTVEQIAIRQEVRQMLNEAGINKNTLKDMVKEVLKKNLKGQYFKRCMRQIQVMLYQIKLNSA